MQLNAFCGSTSRDRITDYTHALGELNVLSDGAFFYFNVHTNDGLAVVQLKTNTYNLRTTL